MNSETNEVQVTSADTIAPEPEKKVRKSPTPKKVSCGVCNKEAFSQAFRIVTAEDGSKSYKCRAKGGCSAAAVVTEVK
jgi:hypothetical protein